MEIRAAQAKAPLSALLDRVENGEQIVISRQGKRVARVVREPSHRISAADALSAVWALGGLRIEATTLMPLDPEPMAVD